MNRGASNSIYKHLIVHTESLPDITAEINSQISCKLSNFGHPVRTGNETLCYKERPPLLLEYSITFLTYVKMIGRVLNSIYEHLMVNSVSFLPKTTRNFHAKFNISGNLSA